MFLEELYTAFFLNIKLLQNFWKINWSYLKMSAVIQRGALIPREIERTLKRSTVAVSFFLGAEEILKNNNFQIHDFYWECWKVESVVYDN